MVFFEWCSYIVDECVNGVEVTVYALREEFLMIEFEVKKFKE